MLTKRLDVMVEGKLGQFFIESDASFPVVKEMLFQLSAIVANIEQEVFKKAKELEKPQEEIIHSESIEE